MSTHSLPSSPTPFIGREFELTQTVALLADRDCRLLTLTGPGGIGKTRLALKAAQAQRDHFPDGVRFVALQALTSPDFIVRAVMDALGTQFFQGDPRQQLLDYLAEKSLLLVLDNVEHLLDDLSLVSDILTRAPGVSILATSRERLNLREEWLYPVKGMSYPRQHPNGDFARYDAVQLFVRSARRLRPDFSLGDEADCVVYICALLDGMPLALELAASWARSLSCADIALEIQRGLDFLETTTRNVEERHRSLRTVLDQSWQQLTEDERAVFQRLSVFRGGFTREAAQAVAGATLRTLSSLVDKSLVTHSANSRYDLHELLRQYASELLDHGGQANTARDTHSTYYANFLFARHEDLKGQRQPDMLDEIEADFENVRVAWMWAVQHHDERTVDRAVLCLTTFCDLRVRFQECETLLRCAEEAFTSDPPSRLWGKIVARRTSMTFSRTLEPQGDMQARIERSLAIAKVNEDDDEIAFCLFLLGLMSLCEGDDDRVKTCFHEALVHIRRTNDLYNTSIALCWVGNVETDINRAIGFYQQSVEVARQIGALSLAAWTLINIGVAQFMVNRLAEAESCLQGARTLFHANRDWTDVAVVSCWRSMIAFASGEFETAAALAQDTLSVHTNYTVPQGKKGALALLSLLGSIRDQNYGQAQQYGEQALALGVGVFEPESVFFTYLGLTVAACGVQNFLSAQYYQAKMLERSFASRRMILAPTLPTAAMIMAHQGEKIQAVELLALAFTHPHSAAGWLVKWPLLAQFRARLETELGPVTYAAAWKRGKTLDLHATLQALLEKLRSSSQEASPPQALIVSYPLSERELDVLRLVADGLTNAAIAERLFLATSTVKWHVSEIMSKLHANNRTQAVTNARSQGLLG